MNPFQTFATEITQLESELYSLMGEGGGSQPGNTNFSGYLNYSSPDGNFNFQFGNNNNNNDFSSAWNDFANLGSTGSGFSGDIGLNEPSYKTEIKDGKQLIDLGNYTLTLNRDSSEWDVTDKTTGQTTKVWGDPHVQTAEGNWDFHKPLTFMLGDGTTITAKTVPYGNGATLTSELDITDGLGRACKVTGLAQNGADGNLTIAGAGDGTQLNAWEMAAADAGNPVVYADAKGGWTTQDGTLVNNNNNF